MKTRDLVYNFVCKYFEEHCYAPSYDEIIKAVGICKSSVHSHMKNLFDEGKLEHDFEDNFSMPRAFRPAGYKCVKVE